MAEKQPIKEQIKKLTDQIEAGIKALFQSGDLEKYQAYLRTMSHFCLLYISPSPRDS